MAVAHAIVCGVYACPPPNQAPEATITPTVMYTCTDKKVVFFADGEDPDGFIVDFKWEFPPGAVNPQVEAPASCEPDLTGPLCWKTSCEFSSTGVYTVKVRVKDDDGAWSPWASCTVYVANVTGVVWEKYAPSNLDIEDDPAAPPNKRIFTGDICWGDGAPSLRSKVRLKATVDPVYAGMPVEFILWDVDDPSANDSGLPEEQCTYPLDCDEPEHNNYDGMSDNRYPCWIIDSGYLLIKKTVKVEAGSNTVEIAVQLGGFPGDNVRVTATTGSFWGADLTWDMVNSGVGLHPQIRRSKMLRVWRKLWLEQDSMGAVVTTGPEQNHVVGTASSYLFDPATGKTLIDLGLILGAVDSAWDGENVFKYGRYIVGGTTFTVTYNSDNWLFPDEVKVKGNCVGFPFNYLLYDDDEGTYNGFTDTWVITPLLPSYPSLGTWANEFRQAYIEVIQLTSWRDIVSFKRHLTLSDVANGTGDWDDSHNLENSDGFWHAFMCSAFQPETVKDNDPDEEQKVFGRQSIGWPFGDRSETVIYLEVIKEWVGLAVGRVMAHEIGHTGGPADNECEPGCIMWGDMNGIPGDHFCLKCLHDFRKDESWVD